MAQLPSHIVVEPFGEVNVYEEGGRKRVRATILMKPAVEGAQTGLALDGSNSMIGEFGANRPISPLFAGSAVNMVDPVAKTLATYLSNFDSDGKTSAIYWACGTGGNEIEDLGDFDANQIAAFRFSGPKRFGTGTKLLPALKHFSEVKFPTAPWTILVFITDGVLEDLEDVKEYSLELGRQLAEGRRHFLKMVLVGVGPHFRRDQLEALDDMDFGGLKLPDGSNVDLWDHKVSQEMRRLEEIFAEIVPADVILVPSAEVVSDGDEPVQPIGRASYADGLPALLEFTLPASARSFTLRLPGAPPIVQSLEGDHTA